MSTQEMVNVGTGEVVAASIVEFDSSVESQFIHIRNDCSAGGGIFKVGDNPFAKSVSGTLIAARVFKNIALFTKKGEESKPQDWVQILFVDEKYHNLKSTLIKTRSISQFAQFINSIKAVNENPCGVSFTMRFNDAEGANGSTGDKFKYKYLTFERNETDGSHKPRAMAVKALLDAGTIHFPGFENTLG